MKGRGAVSSLRTNNVTSRAGSLYDTAPQYLRGRSGTPGTIGFYADVKMCLSAHPGLTLRTSLDRNVLPVGNSPATAIRGVPS